MTLKLKHNRPDRHNHQCARFSLHSFIYVERKHNNTRYTKVGCTHAVSWPSIPELSGQLPFPCRLGNFRDSKRWTEPRNSKQWVQNWGLYYSFHSYASDIHVQSLKTTQINQKSRAELKATLCCKDFATSQFVMKPTSLKSQVDKLLLPSGKLIIKSRLAQINAWLFSEQYSGADKSLARPTSQCILFDG